MHELLSSDNWIMFALHKDYVSLETQICIQSIVLIHVKQLKH